MKLTKLTTAVVALAAAAVLGSSAQAQVTTNYTSGDLLIGFEQQGAASDYVVDLGSATQFLNASTPLNFQLSTTDLAADFTSNWAVNTNGATDVQWGVIGNDEGKVAQSNANTIWYTQGEVVAGTTNAALTGKSASALHQVSSTIQNLETGSGGFSGGTSTSDTTNGINQSATAANSWSSFAPGGYSGGTAFGLGFEIEQPGSGNNVGPTDSVLDLFEYVPGASSASLLGTFSLAGNGDLTFDPQAVPEPSAYALGITALVLFGVLKRRRSMMQA